MLQEGLMDEIIGLNALLRRMLETGPPVNMSKGIWAAIGFKEFELYLESI